MSPTRYLDGKMLISMPTMGDPRFEQSVIFVCAHSADGAMGLIVNKGADEITFPELLSQLGIIPPERAIHLNEQARSLSVQVGGPVETGRGFVLHTMDFVSSDFTLPISETVGLTATLDVLKVIAEGQGPRRAMLALGYAGWGPGQLEYEIQSNGWLHCDPDEELLFGHDLQAKYLNALAKIGVDPRLLSSDVGHA